MGRKHMCVHMSTLLTHGARDHRCTSQWERALEMVLLHTAPLKDGKWKGYIGTRLKGFIHEGPRLAVFLSISKECIGTGIAHLDFLFPFMTRIILFLNEFFY